MISQTTHFEADHQNSAVVEGKGTIWDDLLSPDTASTRAFHCYWKIVQSQW
ncbi:hypothetical protein M407DRAFT_89290 [Tulasnella calospora MUT 4182]|uniref:Uncharacterized protein n=1 Tax=Tulasnella calospora MUT 4182 TaxID=1051891 RepID=A0A0C3QNC9_9AGAM|nr:hypothetical protein M407DRAFT_89290 [Tulasnella calospora MUT 4182]